MTDFHYEPLFDLGADDTPYRQLTADGVTTVSVDGRALLTVEPDVLRLVAHTAFDDIFASAAARASGAAPLHPRRPGGFPQRQIRRARAAAQRKYRRRTGVARLSGHRHGDRDRPQGRERLHRRIRRRRALARHSTTPTTSGTCGTRRWRRSTCSPKKIPGRTCRRRSRSTRSPVTSTSCCSSPRGAGRPTRRFSTRRPRRC